ncbi:pseudouridine synthase [Mailhella sp.]|uniref:pseudouridine synthase n=1 Tax=Mailhella sp. TaxID=1981029 RepID=UPI004062C752
MEHEKNRQGLAVSRAEAGQKLLNFLQRRVDAPTGDFHRWIRTGQVRVNGTRAKAFDRVAEGDMVRVPPFAVFLPAGSGNGKEHADRPENPMPKPRPDTARKPAPSSLSIVYEDEDVLVIAKPAGLPVQGGTGHSDSIASRLAAERAGADFVPAPVHRLDKDTTGLLVAGKTYAAVRLLTDALAGRSGTAPRKEYLAWVQGRWPFSPEDGPQELRDFLAKDQKAQRMKTVRSSKNGETEGQEARCVVTALETRRIPEGSKNSEYSLLLVRLLTGRTHQIRVQLASRGHAVAGDPWYGKDADGLKLHAFRLSLPLPNGETRTLELLPPWKGAWKVTKV